MLTREFPVLLHGGPRTEEGQVDYPLTLNVTFVLVCDECGAWHQNENLHAEWHSKQEWRLFSASMGF